jgi:protein TonB
LPLFEAYPFVTMAIPSRQALDVFSAREIARAAATSTADAEALLESGRVSTCDGVFVEPREAIRAVLLLRGVQSVQPSPPDLFQPATKRTSRPGFPLTASGLLHAVAFALALFATFGVTSRAEVEPQSKAARLVFLVRPGPGGGGGGGGLRQPAPARPALLKGKSALKSPVPIERPVRRPVPEPAKPRPPRPPEIQPAARPIDPPAPVAKVDPPPPVVAPVASIPSDPIDARGVMSEGAATTNSQGAGKAGGAGSGSGTGLGEGIGSGIGAGSGAGTGGGPYRPGSGISAPELVREVKPDYTEEARRRSLSGDVVLEIIVRSDGRVGAIKVLQGLGSGLNERAVDAVRQWQFTPARRLGTPVDVLVEVAVEFRLR